MSKQDLIDIVFCVMTVAIWSLMLAVLLNS